ncbi:MAG: lipid A biosynthesis acyltransferase [Sphingobacteriales bacterium]|nr:MAG: lipid A biosynthesis acyltransferase [Sphingobacteriales bacterium]
MQALAYYIALPFIYLVSILPFPLLYAVSDFMFFILYRVAGYRKEVVLANLRNSFPEKSDVEIRSIAYRFYAHLCDLFLETFKTLTVSPAVMLEHCTIAPGAKKLLDDLADRNQSIILVMGHQGNWEWGGNSFSLLCRQQLYVIYHPLQQKYFNGLISRMRGKFGTRLIPMKETFKEMVRHRSELTATAFIADQSPNPSNAYWTRFLNQDTPVFWGTERISSKMKFPVVYLFIKKLRRGYYEMDAEMLVEQTEGLPEGTITEAFTRRLEQDIIMQPETWLWSHRRWKHKRPQ